MKKFKTKKEAIEYCFEQIKPSIIGLSDYNRFRLIRNRYNKNPNSVKDNAIENMFEYFEIDKECIYYKKIKTYLIKDISKNIYKIGKSKNPEIRRKTLKPKSTSLKIVHVIYSDIERFLHKRFEPKNIKGEWYNLDKEDVDYIKNINNFYDIEEDFEFDTNRLLDTSEFYKYLLRKLEADMIINNLTGYKLRSVKKGGYIVSSSTFDNIKAVSENKSDKLLNNKNLNKICEYLGIKFEYKFVINV